MTPRCNSRSTFAPLLSDAQRKAFAVDAMRRCWKFTGMLIAASALVLIPACAPPRPEPAPAPTPGPSPAAAPSQPQQSIANWETAPTTPGTWTYRSDGNVTRALFGTTQSGTQFTMACEKANRQVRLWRAGTAASPADTNMTIATTSSTRTIPAAVQTGVAPQLAASLSPSDSIIDAMVFSRGRFAVAAKGLPLLVMPSWAEMARVAQDCR